MIAKVHGPSMFMTRISKGGQLLLEISVNGIAAGFVVISL